MNHQQKNALILIAMVVIVSMGLFWAIDRQVTDERVAKRLRAEIEARVEHENTYTLDYARAFFTNQLIFDVDNGPELGFDEISREQLFWNVFRMWNLRKTKHWNRTNFDAERVMVDSLQLLRIRNAEQFESQFKETDIYKQNQQLFRDPNTDHLSDLINLVRSVIQSSGLGTVKDSD